MGLWRSVRALTVALGPGSGATAITESPPRSAEFRAIARLAPPPSLGKAPKRHTMAC